MLAGLVGAVVGGGLLLRGAWDLWAQSALILVLLAGLAAWLCGRVIAGWVPCPESRLSAWAGALASASAVAAFWSPVAVYARPACAASIVGLALFPIVSAVDTEGREKLERLLRAAGWALVLVAAYQRVHGVARPPSSLLNPNAFAGAILLLLPLSARARDWALVAGLLLCLWWTRSVGAWMGLAAALLLHRRAVGPFAFWAGAAAGSIGLIAILAKLQSPEALHRLAWWGAAWRMAADSPWIGLGPGSFAYALAAYVPARPELSSLYAHQHVLETAAERGWPYAGLWLAGLFVLLQPASAGRRFGPVAALIHGLVDYALAVPGVFWLFCASAALAAPESGRAANVPLRRRPAIGALTALALGACALSVWRAWSADRLRAGATTVLREQRLDEAETLLAASESLSPHPEAARLRAEIALASRPERVVDAAAHLRRAVRMDPYRASNRDLLEAVSRR
ncbi:MAG: O-antigen ligase family protein [Elusimicrobia bacterium]|nr:O-antigen ligase family protein [Elusimicrobiota bacterium]